MRLKVIKNTIVVLTFGLIFSCKDVGEGYVRGTIYETGTDIPIAGIPVTLLYETATPASYQYTHSDKDGNYLIYFNKKQGLTYYVTCGNDSSHFNSSGNGVLQYKKTVRDFSLAPLAYLKLHVKKTTSYQWQGVNISDNDDYIGFFISNNNPFDTIFPKVFKIPGNSKITLNWQLNKPYNIYYDSSQYIQGTPVFVGKNDTVIYTIQYQ